MILIQNDTIFENSFWQQKIDIKLKAYSELKILSNIEALNKALDVALSLNKQNNVLLSQIPKTGISFMLAVQLQNKLKLLGL